MKSIAGPIASMVAIIFASQAYAQESTTPPSDPATPTAQAGDTSNALQDIVVTAQRRSENLQRAAVAVDVVSGDVLTNGGVSTNDRLGNLVPALSITPSNGGRLNFFLRGVGNFTVNPAFDSAVAFNYDNVYIGRPGSTGGFLYDLERVEVLKGPQGTLYGRNATGGAINVIPVKPKPGEFSGYLTGSYGNYDAYSVEGAVNVPMGPNGALRVSGNYSKRDGYLTDGMNDDDTGSIRVQMMAELTPDLTVRVSGDYTAARGEGAGANYVNSYVPTGANSFTVTPSGFDPAIGLYDPRAQAYRRGLLAAPAGTFLTDIVPDSRIHNDFYGANAEIALRTDLGTLTFIPAFRTDHVLNSGVTTGFYALTDAKDTQFSAELRFAGERIGAFDYTLGAFYYNEKNDVHLAINNQALYNNQDFTQKTNSYAAFARVTGHLTESLRLVGGARYTKDRKVFDADGVALSIVCPTFPPLPCLGAVPTPLFPSVYNYTNLPSQFVVPANGGPPTRLGQNGAILVRSADQRQRGTTYEKSKPTFHVGVEYDLGPRSLLYAHFENGFRSGGTQIATGFETYAPEIIDAYTIGSKNRLFNNRLQLNGEAFYWKYKNQQLASIGFDNATPPIINNFIKNAGNSTSYGFDVEAVFLATPDTLLNTQVQYLHTKYDNFVYDAPSVLPTFTTCTVIPRGGINVTVDCSGKPAYNSPRWTVNLGAQQTFHIADYKLVASADTQYRSSRWVGFEYAVGQFQGSTWQSNAQLTFSPASEDWSISGFVRNIENERYKVNSAVYTVGSTVVATTAAPRTYGVRASMKF